MLSSNFIGLEKYFLNEIVQLQKDLISRELKKKLSLQENASSYWNDFDMIRCVFVILPIWLYNRYDF